jgi:multicomponent Na+:H+ antiporter subunit E
MKYIVIGLYILFWIILSQNISIEVLVVGVLICIAVAMFNKDLLRDNNKKNNFNLENILSWINYVGILLKEIVISNFHVAKVVLSPQMKISPELINYKTKIKSDFCRTIFANSITLTPGTITVLMEDENMLIHCLEKESVEDISNSKFEKIILKVEE